MLKRIPGTETLKKTLFDHQERALGKLPKEGGYLAFEQGLGKTLTAIRYANDWQYWSVLVVCPAVAVGVWVDELTSEGYSVLAPTGSRLEKAAQIKAESRYVGYQYIVLNYEALLEKKVEQAVVDWLPDLLVVDEAQKIKTATAKRSKVLHRLGKTTPALLLSGTPITRNLLDLYSQYKVIDPMIWDGEPWTRFKQRYGVWGGYGGYELMGYQNTEVLKEAIAPWTVVARKEDTLDLPPKIHETVPVTLTGKSWVEYSRMANTGVNSEWVTTNPLEKALRLSQLASRAKVQATVEFVNGLREQGLPVVVYARFRKELALLSDMLGVQALSGDTPMARRSEMVALFQAGDTNIFLSQITAGSTAITLTRASHMVYHGLTYGYEDWAQSQDRIHRIGQYDPCNYYYITAMGPKGGITIDGLVSKALENKEDVAAMVTRDPNLLLTKETQ